MGLSPGTETGINQPESKREILPLVSLVRSTNSDLAAVGATKKENVPRALK